MGSTAEEFESTKTFVLTPEKISHTATETRTTLSSSSSCISSLSDSRGVNCERGGEIDQGQYLYDVQNELVDLTDKKNTNKCLAFRTNTKTWNEALVPAPSTSTAVLISEVQSSKVASPHHHHHHCHIQTADSSSSKNAELPNRHHLHAIKWRRCMELSLTLDGRDKMTKLAQYMARFLAWWLASNSKRIKALSSNKALSIVIQHMILRFKGLQESLSTSRRAFRLGRTLTEFQKLYDLELIETIVGHFFYDVGDNDGNTSWSFFKLIGSAVKMIGLMGYYLADNVVFLTGTGLFDNYHELHNKKDHTTRFSQRKVIQRRASALGNRFFFVGAVAGLLTTLQSYHELTQAIKALQQKNIANETEVNIVLEKDENIDCMRRQRDLLFIGILKSCCDVLVFSNNHGLDLWMKCSGGKLHEGLHSSAGIISASLFLLSKSAVARTST